MSIHRRKYSFLWLASHGEKIQTLRLSVPEKSERRVGVLFGGWEACSKSRLAIELGLLEKSAPKRPSGLPDLAIRLIYAFFLFSVGFFGQCQFFTLSIISPFKTQ
jgi:hypothetical protein